VLASNIVENVGQPIARQFNVASVINDGLPQRIVAAALIKIFCQLNERHHARFNGELD
jgi:hypothetical protein